MVDFSSWYSSVDVLKGGDTKTGRREIKETNSGNRFKTYQGIDKIKGER